MYEAAHDPALSRHLRRRHGEGQPARRRQRLGAPPGRADLGTRCEIKNVNSIRFIRQAIEYEARRQIDIIEDGGTIDQETRLFDPAQGRDALDALQGRGARLPLLPRPRPAAAGTDAGLGRRDRSRRCRSCRTTRRRASSSDYGPVRLRRRRADRRAARRRLFEARRQGPRRASWRPTGSPTSCSAVSNKEGLEIGQSPDLRRPAGGHRRPDRRTARSPARSPRTCSRSSGRGRRRRREIVEKRGLRQVTDTGAIETAIDEMIAANPDKVAAGEGQAPGARLVRRPGDEGDGRQGQPGRRQRPAEEEAGDLINADIGPSERPLLPLYPSGRSLSHPTLG